MDKSLELQMQSNTHILHAKVRARFHFLAFYHKICQISYYSLSFGACYLNYTQLTGITKLNANLLKKHTVIPGTTRLRPTTLHDMLMYSSGTRRTKANKRRAAGVLR